MTVYVDDVRIPAKVGRFDATWSHLTADTRNELHAFAGHLGLKRAWFQDPAVNGKPRAEPGTLAAEMWHYDVTETKRQQAIRLGAVPIPWRDLPAIIEARYAAATAEATQAADTDADWHPPTDPTAPTPDYRAARQALKGQQQ